MHATGPYPNVFFLINFSTGAFYVKCQTPSKAQTDKQANGQRDTFVCLSICQMSLSGASILGRRSAMLYRNLKGGGGGPGSTNKYTKFGQLIIREIIKRLPHFEAKMHHVRFRAPAVIIPGMARREFHPLEILTIAF